ncbi:hypothetical protein [Streptomyces clavuligerus]|uniref:hypothetical protein n=1 Tax=Streptomyces clavuligerus TaxID=1901 RepID=UPI003B96AE51
MSPSGGFGLKHRYRRRRPTWAGSSRRTGRWAGRQLLDTYQTERRPIAVESLEEGACPLAAHHCGGRVPPASTARGPRAGGRARRWRNSSGTAASSGSSTPREIHFGLRYTLPRDHRGPHRPRAPRKAGRRLAPRQRARQTAPRTRGGAGHVHARSCTGAGFVLLCFAGHEGVAGVRARLRRTARSR